MVFRVAPGCSVILTSNGLSLSWKLSFALPAYASCVTYVLRFTFYVLRLPPTFHHLDIRARNSVRSIYTVLDGELAMPCNPRLASAGLNSLSRYGIVGLRLLSSVDDRVLRGGSL
jgi:hypothetical protein